jgi:hypothetical protein
VKAGYLRRFEHSSAAGERAGLGKNQEMGFLFYANFVRFVLRGSFAIVLVEQARALMRAAGVAPESE